jgi:hypothetical protein
LTEPGLELILASIAAAGLGVYIAYIASLWRSRRGDMDEGSGLLEEGGSGPTLPIHAEPQIRSVEPIAEGPPTGRGSETLEDILGEILARRLHTLDLDTVVELSSEGDYNLLGRSWRGQVTLRLQPKKAEAREQAAGAEERGEGLF